MCWAGTSVAFAQGSLSLSLILLSYPFLCAPQFSQPKMSQLFEVQYPPPTSEKVEAMSVINDDIA